MTEIKIEVKNAKIYNLKELQTKNGKKFVVFGIRADWNNNKAYWLQCAIWDTSADMLNANLPISFCGYLNGRTYTNKIGIVVDTFNVNVQKWEQQAPLSEEESNNKFFEELNKKNEVKDDDTLAWFENEDKTQLNVFESEPRWAPNTQRSMNG